MATPIRLDGLLAKVESTYNTDPTPTVGDDGIRVSDRVWSSLTYDYAFPNQRTEATNPGSLLPTVPAAPKGRFVSFEIAVEIRGYGGAMSSSNLPEVDPLMKACGFLGTLTNTTKISYSYAATAHSSCTIWAYGGGLRFKVRGCRGTVRIPITAGNVGTMIFSMQGIAAEPETVALPTITYNTTIPAIAAGMTMTVGSWAPDIVSAEFASNTEVQMIPDGNAADGINSFEISSMAPTFSLSAKAVGIGSHGAANFNPYTDLSGVTNRTIDMLIGDTQYKQMKLDVNTSRLASIGHVNQEEFAGWDLVWNLYDGAIDFD